MSHFKQRKEKNCLNCSKEVSGHFCQNCGQENVEPKQTVGHLVSHFFNDVTHFDGKFFSTIGTLIRRPGFLTAEYVKGRRMAYLDPIKMYIFTSAIFFIVFFKMYHLPEHIGIGSKEAPVTLRQITDSVKSGHNAGIYFEKDTLHETLRPDSAKKHNRKDADGISISVFNDKIQTVAQYDSVQNALPAAKRDNWSTQKVVRRFLKSKTAQDDPVDLFLTIGNRFLHSFPQLLIISLPLFALILKLLYVRRKQFYYTDHGIFSIHLYVFTFINLLVQLLVFKLADILDWEFLWVLNVGLVIWIFIYLYKALHRFYGQNYWKTTVKFIFLNFLAFILMFMLVIGSVAIYSLLSL